MVVAAGLFLVRRDNKILVAHPTNHKPNFWSIPKGKVEEGEAKIDAAIRETFEETNVDVSDWTSLHTLEAVQYEKTPKIIHPFILFETENDIDFDKFVLRCNSNVTNKKTEPFPEMDGFKWVTLEEAKNLLHKTQVLCLESIQKLIDKKNKVKS